MNSVITIFILLGYVSKFVLVEQCTKDEISACIKQFDPCECSTPNGNEDSSCKLICKDLNSRIDSLFNPERNESNVIQLEKLTFADVEITYSGLSKLNAIHMRYFEKAERLNFSHNEISLIPNNTFHNFTNLESLDLSHNNLSNVPDDLLKNLINLKYLSLAANHIKSIKPIHFRDLKDLLTLNISKNSLTEVPKDIFNYTQGLKVLSLAHNKLRSLPDRTFQGLYFLEVLDLSYNELRTLQPQLFKSLKALRNLSISHNQIKTLDKETFVDIKRSLVYIDLVGNPWNCGKSQYWVYIWIESKTTVFESKTNLLCHEPEYLANRTFSDDLQMVHMMNSIEECDLCKKCKCDIVRERMIVVVNCTNRNLTSVPQKLPYRTRKVVLDNNKIKSLVIDAAYIYTWTFVSFLGLNNNLVSSLQTLEELLQLKHIIVLNITENKLQDVPIHLLDQLSYTLNELRLSGNPWICNCNTVRFQIWLQDHHRQIQDIENIRCAKDDTPTSNRVIYTMMKSELCPQPAKPLDYLDILNITMGLLILIIICKVTYDYWHQKKTGKLPKFFGLNMP